MDSTGPGAQLETQIEFQNVPLVVANCQQAYSNVLGTPQAVKGSGNEALRKMPVLVLRLAVHKKKVLTN